MAILSHPGNADPLMIGEHCRARSLALSLAAVPTTLAVHAARAPGITAPRGSPAKTQGPRMPAETITALKAKPPQIARHTPVLSLAG